MFVGIYENQNILRNIPIINFYIRRIIDTTYISRYNRVQHKFIGNMFPLLAQIELAIN